jgi:hypothetical protein
MSLRAAYLVFAAKQSPVVWEIASDKEQERPRNDISLSKPAGRFTPTQTSSTHLFFSAIHWQLIHNTICEKE